MDQEATYSHPESPIRHTYPLSVKEKGVVAAATLCLKTLPIMLLRLGILMACTIAAMIWFGLVFGATAMMGRVFNGPLLLIPLLIGLGLPFGVFSWLKGYVLFLLKMAHIAVLTRLITHGELESGKSQIEYGKEAVTGHFGEVNILMALDGLVHGVVIAFTRTLDWMVNLLPIPGVEGPMGMVRNVLNNATRYVGETIFSYNLARGDENKWRSSKDGLIYYAQNWKPILKTAVYALILEYVLTGVMFVLFIGPAYALAAFFPHIGIWALLFAALFAFNVKSAVLRPIFLTMVMLTYHESVYNQPINLEWDQTLTGASEQFKEIAERAKSWVAQKMPDAVPGTSAAQPTVS